MALALSRNEAGNEARNENRLGYLLAVLAHGALLAWLLLKPAAAVMPPAPPAMEVTISDSVGLTATAPAPAAQPAPAEAPQLGKPAEAVEPVPVSVAVSPPKPLPIKAAAPDPMAKILQSLPKTHAKVTKPAVKPAGASKIGQNFLKGAPLAVAKGTAHSPAAAAIGPAVRSSLAGAISRQLKPHWEPPDGADDDQLATVLTWSLNRDGSLAGDPSVVRQEGITDANRPQARRHAEQAIRAVKLSAPFQLPPEYYDAWKRVAAFRFDRNLAQ